MDPNDAIPPNEAPQPPPAAPTPPAAPAGPDAPDKEKMDQIRRRRLEKLGGPAPAKKENSTDNSSKDAGSEQTTPQSRPATPMEIDPPAADSSKMRAQQASSETAAQRPQVAPPKSSQTTINITPANPTEKRRRELSAGNSGPPTRKPTPLSKEETQEDFENRVISQLFRITVDANNRTDANGHKLMMLWDLEQELEESNEPRRLSLGNIDSALMEACTKVSHQTKILDYLLPCWKRITKMLKTTRNMSAEKHHIVNEAKRLCMSNCIFALTMPELYGRDEHAKKDNLAAYLVNEADGEKGICPDWLTEAVSRWDEDEAIKPMFQKAARMLSNELSLLSMNDNYKPYVSAMKSLTRFTLITNAIAEDASFQLAVTAANIEKFTTLGPFFRLSPLSQAVYDTYFPAPKTLDKGRIATAQAALRMSLNTHQKDLLDIVNQFVRASDKSRERTLAWFAYIMNKNKKRRAMRVDEREVASDGFMMNVTVVLDYLCEPFMDSTFSKVGRIDKDYFLKKPRIDIADETKLNADQKTSDEFYEKKIEEGKPNFITEVFFLTLAAHHYGSETLNSKMKSLDRQIKQFLSQLVEFEHMRTTHAASPANMRVLEINTQRYNEALEKSMQLKMTIEGVLFDDLMQARSLTFMRYVMVFMLRVASGTDYVPGKEFKLPLPEVQTEIFKNYPEYMFEDVVKNANFIFRYLPKVMISSQVDELVIFCITFLRNSEYIKNPALKQGLVTLLFHGTHPVYHKAKGVLGDALTADEFATKNLLHSLMKFYIEIEFSGNFYDKFNIRYEIFQIFKCIWTNPIYKQNLEQESKVNTDFFIQYVNLLLNDTTFLLDECLSKFPKIHDLQAALDPLNPTQLNEEEKKAKLEELQKLEGVASSYMQLANETIHMMIVFTQTLSEAFTMPEIVQRLADMLDYNLRTLVGEKSSELKVQDATKYHFHPRQLLAEIADIYLNLSKRTRFIEAIARDGRSYRPEIFDNAMRIMERFSLKSREELAAWSSLAKRVEKQKALDEQLEADLGDIPEEFLDPLMAELMEDPVILPTSRNTIDRKTIRTYLLSDPKDPFNRQPLSIEEVVPDLEMKAKIDAWKEERRKEVRRKMDEKAEEEKRLAEAVEDADKMDTSA